MKKNFIITIDTEGDNMWRRFYTENAMKRITNKNGDYLYRFQELCERYGMIPTYLVNYEMSQSKAFVELGREGLKKKTLEIGMHMHGWNCPPYYKLQAGNKFGGDNPYIYEYPENIIEKKVDYLTKFLEDTFQTKIKSHRSGRWYIDSVYIKILKKYGYMVDCSVTPGVNWSSGSGLTEGSRGSNYNRYPSVDYEVNLDKIYKSGKSGFFEVPVTIGRKKREKWFKYENIWLRPNGSNLKDMCKLIKLKQQQEVDYVEFMLHSSEMMPGGSPYFKTESEVNKLYYDMDKLFKYASKNYQGIGLTEYVLNKYMQYHRKE